MYFVYCAYFALVIKLAASAPASGFNFPEERRQKKLEPVITPPVLPVLEHLERDPSTLLPSDHSVKGRNAGSQSRVPSGRAAQKGRAGDPRFGFGGGFSVAPSGNGGLTASLSHSANGGGASQAASQSFSFGFNPGFSASHSASQSSSFNGFGSGLSGSQASSQAGSFSGSGPWSSGGSLSGAASSASSLAGGGGTGSQSASSAFGFNGFNNPNSYPPYDEVNFDDIDIRHRGAPGFPFPKFPGGRGVGTAVSSRRGPGRNRDEFLTVLLSD